VSAVRVLAATVAELPDAQALVFEYMASTQREAGRAVPGSIDQLPDVLHTECTDLAAAYQPPGALLLAYHGQQPIGCVGLKPIPPAGTIEVKRLYVRPTHRRAGAASILMHHAHRHAADHSFAPPRPRRHAHPHPRHRLLPQPRIHRRPAAPREGVRPHDLPTTPHQPVVHPSTGIDNSSVASGRQR
jgi:GNAT superfamily N-acetyltransferase